MGLTVIAFHSSDLWYWFGTQGSSWRPMEGKDFELSDQMTDYLTNFAKTSDPNGEELPVNNTPRDQAYHNIE